MGAYNKLRWSYATSKLLDDYLSRAYFEHRGLPVTMARLFNTIGPGQVSNYGMVVPRFFEQALKNDPITVYGDGEQTRCFSDVRDVVESLVRLVSCRAAFGELVNIGSTEEVSITTLARQIVELTGSRSQLQYIPFEQVYGNHFEDMNRRVPSVDKLKKLTGY